MKNDPSGFLGETLNLKRNAHGHCAPVLPRSPAWHRLLSGVGHRLAARAISRPPVERGLKGEVLYRAGGAAALRGLMSAVKVSGETERLGPPVIQDLLLFLEL